LAIFKKDILISVFVGIFTALVWISVLIRLHTLEGFGLPDKSVWVLIVFVPVVYVLALYLAGWLSRRWSFFESFAKFVMVGFLNTGVDFAVFNFLMFVTGNDQPGLGLAVFKAIAFIVAVTNSYFWNKHWAFKAGSSDINKGEEFAKFFAVNVGAALINVGITSGITVAVSPQFGFSQVAWNNIAAVAATAFVLIWNFVGFKLIVFKKNAGSIS